jgi:serine/threonine protein kinase
MGVLQIADFGLGTFHGRDSRSRVNPDTIFSSPTYEPPECKLRKPVSRAYDIWSLGCLYLEFITWLLKGSAEIEGFSEFRGRLASTDINDDNFFTITRDSNSGPEAVVREQVIDWVNKLHEHEKCSALIHDLLDMIMGQLLVVDSKKRTEARWLYHQLKTYLDKAKENKQYLLEPESRPRNSGSSARPMPTSAVPDAPNTRRNVTFSDPENAVIPATAQSRP